MRAFLAVPVEPPSLAPLQLLLERLRTTVPGVRWVRGDGLHLTVHFFGELRADDAVLARETVRPIATATTPFELHVDHVGDFNHGAVLWCGTGSGSDALSSLALRCRDALAGAGFAVEQRRFRAHCTLGRARRRLDADARDAWSASAADVAALPAFTAKRLVLFESRPGAGGTEHVPHDVLTFGG